MHRGMHRLGMYVHSARSEMFWHVQTDRVWQPAHDDLENMPEIADDTDDDDFDNDLLFNTETM